MSEKRIALVQNPLGASYDSMEFTLANSLTDYDVGANVTGAFESLDYYTTVNIRSDQSVTVKLNSTDNRAVTVQANKPFELDNILKVKEIYLSNSSGNTANIKIIGARKSREEG